MPEPEASLATASRVILGLYQGYNANACLLVEGEPTVIVENERHTRVRHAYGPSAECVEACLRGAGMAIGPWGLGLVGNVDDILHFAEFGVVLMLFLVGLELEPRRLWSLRRPIFGWGSAQVLGCAAALAGVAVALGVAWPTAVVAALGLALSSTAIALQVMQERNLLRTSSGQAGFSILLFQDVAAIPILALLPLLGGLVDGVSGSNPALPSVNRSWEAIKVIGIVGGVCLLYTSDAADE